MCNKQQGLSIRLLDVLSDIAMTMELLYIVMKGRLIIVLYARNLSIVGFVLDFPRKYIMYFAGLSIIS
jgi:hypothetical protein